MDFKKENTCAKCNELKTICTFHLELKNCLATLPYDYKEILTFHGIDMPEQDFWMYGLVYLDVDYDTGDNDLVEVDTWKADKFLEAHIRLT